jgi:hypothetical protein
MRPDQACIATAIYAPVCGCHIRIQIKRGAAVPVCPLCHARSAWQFVQSVHIAAFDAVPFEEAAGREVHRTDRRVLQIL